MADEREPYEWDGPDDGRYPETDFTKPLPRYLVEGMRARGFEPPERFLAPEDRLPEGDSNTEASDAR